MNKVSTLIKIEKNILSGEIHIAIKGNKQNIREIIKKYLIARGADDKLFFQKRKKATGARNTQEYTEEVTYQSAC